MTSAGGGRNFVVLLKQFEDSFERIWGDWIDCVDISLLRPDHEEADVFNLHGHSKRFGPDWENPHITN